MRSNFLLLVTAATLPFVLAGCAGKTQAPEGKLPSVVSTATAEIYSPEKSTEAHYSAVVAPDVQVDLAFKASGYVDSILKTRDSSGRLRLAQEGDFVRRGTVLASVRPTEYQSRVNEQSAALDEVRQAWQRAQAALSASQASFDSAKTAYDRTARLYQSESVTKPDYDSAKTNFEINQARVTEAKAAINVDQATERRLAAGLASARLTLQDCQLRAPMNGVIIKRNVEEGSLAAQGTVAFTLADTSRMKVSFGVPDVQLRQLKRGDSLSFTTEALPGRVFSGRITDIAPAADARSRVFNVEVSVPNSDHLLKSGMVAALVVHEDNAGAPVLTVPLSAVVRSSGNPDQYAVFVVHDNSGKYTAQEQPVKLGEAFGQSIAVLQGLRQGDKVVTTGATRIVSNQEIEITN